VDIFLTGAFGLDAALTHAIAAEHQGLGGVWFAEHHFTRYGQIPSATLFAMRVLDHTSQITVGTMACAASTRDPVALAEEAAMLHHTFGERFQLGVARGNASSFEGWLAALLAELHGTRIVPQPPARPSVRVAAVSPQTVETAAKFGLPLQLGVEKTDVEVAGLTARWGELSGVEGADHTRLLLLGSPSRGDLDAWLRRKDSRDWSAHLDRLLAIHPVADPLVPRPVCMVEAAGSIEATTGLIAALASWNPWSAG
jgi:Luciferase-like monooxygenase